MPKEKLSSKEKIERFKRKIEELQTQRKRRRLIIFSDDSDSDNDAGHSTNIVPTSPKSVEEQTTVPLSENEVSLPTSEAPLDPELLAALGEYTSDNPEFGPSIHDSLAKLWSRLLPKENRDEILKEYSIPSNCTFLQAPKLNPEISAAITDMVRNRDKKLANVQQQLGQGVTAVNRAMDVLLKSENKVEAIKHLSDGCRILSNLHYSLTKDRTKLIVPNLERSFNNVIQDAERDEYLFGNSLPDKIRANKAIEKQGQQIKKVSIAPKTNAPTTSARPSTSHQGNWQGPPRYSSNRGGRGGYRKMDPLPATRRPYITSTAQPRPQTQVRTRVLTRQNQR